MYMLHTTCSIENTIWTSHMDTCLCLYIFLYYIFCTCKVSFPSSPIIIVKVVLCNFTCSILIGYPYVVHGEDELAPGAGVITVFYIKLISEI